MWTESLGRYSWVMRALIYSVAAIPSISPSGPKYTRGQSLCPGSEDFLAIDRRKDMKTLMDASKKRRGLSTSGRIFPAIQGAVGGSRHACATHCSQTHHGPRLHRRIHRPLPHLANPPAAQNAAPTPKPSPMSSVIAPRVNERLISNQATAKFTRCCPTVTCPTPRRFKVCS